MKAQKHITGSQIISQNTTLMILSMMTLWFFAMLFYTETYQFWDFSISSLGSTKTPNGSPNRISFFLFILSMIITFRIMWSLAGYYRVNKSVNYKLFTFLYYLGSVGAVIICFPTNLYNSLHAVGGGLLVFSHLFITVVHIIAQKNIVTKRQLFNRLLFLFIPILIYSFIWVIWLEPVVHIFQKIAFVSLFVLEKRTTEVHNISLEHAIFTKSIEEKSSFVYSNENP